MEKYTDGDKLISTAINYHQEERHPNKYAMEEISGEIVPLKRGLIAPYFRSTVNLCNSK